MIENKTARDIMQTPVITTSEDMLLAELIKIMANNHITGLPVLDNKGNLSGMITWRLIMTMAIMDDVTNTRVRDAMSLQLDEYGPTCTIDTPIDNILKHFRRRRINRMIVVDESGLNRKVIGIICRCDIISVMNQIYNS